MLKNTPPSLEGPLSPSQAPLTPAEVANSLKVSVSWLAKARMRGAGPPFMRVGRSIRYFPLGPWMEAQRQLSMKKS
jgi:hypothetical protein